MTIADDAVPEVADPAGYPVEWEFDGLLRNGEAVVVRPIRSADAPALIGLRGAVSPGTHQHVLLDGPALSRQAAARFSEVDYDARMAFVALVSDEMVGLASYDRPDARAPAAEASFIVAGDRRGHGITTLLFESLAEYARTRGILCFTAEVRAQNTAMLELFAATGLRYTRRDGPATVRVEIDLQPTAADRSSCDQREAMAEVASVAAILRPRSIAVVGAGRPRATSGIRWSGRCSPAISRELCTRLTRPPGRSAACPHSRRCCLGGVMTDLLQDRAFAVPPLEPGAAEAMVASLRAAPLLDGYRGAPKADRQALVAVLEQVARVAVEVPELVELDLNPVLVSSAGALAIGSELCSGSATCARNARPLGPAPAKTRGSGLPASRG